MAQKKQDSGNRYPVFFSERHVITSDVHTCF